MYSNCHLSWWVQDALQCWSCSKASLLSGSFLSGTQNYSWGKVRVQTERGDRKQRDREGYALVSLVHMISLNTNKPTADCCETEDMSNTIGTTTLLDMKGQWMAFHVQFSQIQVCKHRWWWCARTSRTAFTKHFQVESTSYQAELRETSQNKEHQT